MKYNQYLKFFACVSLIFLFAFPFSTYAKDLCCFIQGWESQHLWMPSKPDCGIRGGYQVPDKECPTPFTPPPVSAPPPVKTYKPILQIPIPGISFTDITVRPGEKISVPSVSAPPPVKTYKPILQIPIPGISFTDITVRPGEKISVPWIAQYIIGIYNFSLYAAVIIATVVMMVSGLMWLIAGGNQATIGRAKEYIANAAIGLVILLSSYLILRQINPKLVDFSAVKIQVLSGGGTCGSWQTQSGINTQCQDVSQELFTFLVCLRSQLPDVSPTSRKPYVISSVSGPKGAAGCKEGLHKGTYKPGSTECPHATTSCHFGGPYGNGCTQSYAVDILDDDGKEKYIDPKVAQEIIDAAHRCSVNFARGPKELATDGDPSGNHDDHVHLSVGKKCSCE